MTYVARTSVDGTIRIYPPGQPQTTPVATLHLSPGGRLRETLRAAGWQPTGDDGPGGAWGAIYVQPTRRHGTSGQ